MNTISLTHKTFLFFAAIFLLSCNEIDRIFPDSFLTEYGILDPDTPSPETIDILCDASDGSTCDEKNLRETLLSVFQLSFLRPGSKIRLWNLGVSISETVSVAEATSPIPEKKKGRKAPSSNWPDETTARFLNAIKAEWKSPPPRRTPLAESITKISNTDAFGYTRIIIVLTDSREYRLGNFECRPPSIEGWRQLLKQHGALPPDSLQNIEVIFSNVSMPPIRGCDLSLSRENKIRELWKTAMKDAGAVFSITSGIVRFHEKNAEDNDQQQGDR